MAASLGESKGLIAWEHPNGSSCHKGQGRVPGRVQCATGDVAGVTINIVRVIAYHNAYQMNKVARYVLTKETRT